MSRYMLACHHLLPIFQCPNTPTPHTVSKTLWGARMLESSNTLLGAVRTFTDQL